jgi:signal transduction histidine kinase
MPWAALFRRRDVDGVDTTEAWVVFLVDSQDGSQGLKEVLGPGQGTARDRLMDRLGLRGEAIGSADAICLIAVDRYGSDDMPNWMAVALRSCELRLRRWIARDLERLIFEYPALMRRHFAPTTERLRDLLAQEKARAAEMEATNQALRRTEQERVWEQRQRMRAERDAVWKELAARIAHKLGNPVAVVSLIEANLRDHIRPDDEEGIDILNDLSNTVKRMKTYIAEFTSHVKATSTLMEAMPLSNVIANLSTSPMMRHGDVQLSEFTSGVTVKVDLQKLLEVFEELFSNARSIAKDEGMVPQIRVHWALKDKPPRESGLHEGRAYLRISIEDNGPGVKDKHKESIFLPYVTTRAEGSGQGLAIVRRIVEDHEGAIIEDGLSGSGACFHIFLPAYGDEK